MKPYRIIKKRPVKLPQGFRASAGAAGLKPSGKPDVALVAADEPVPCAGVFTRSMIKAAPVLYCQRRLRSGHARAVFTNAGIANASTGKRGMQDTESIAESVGVVLQCEPHEILVCSTGVIGHRLDVRVLNKAIPPLVNSLSPDKFDGAATAIHTTDTKQKDVALSLTLGKTKASLVGMCKGAGMIAPNMATMLAYLFTDVAVEPKALKAALRSAVRTTFNNITIDGDTSTNDTVLLFANGRAGNEPITEESPDYAAFAESVHAACDSLARQVVLDGEGATKFVTLHVNGAPSDSAARQIGLTVANSPLVKTAIFGADPNYGRLIMAIGRAGVPIDEDALTIKCGRITMLKNGEVVDFNQEKAAEYLQGDEIEFSISIGPGTGAARILTCDLSYDYVKINAEYTT